MADRAEPRPPQLGYAFHDPSLLERALTHRSSGSPHNEQLEFLGDAVIGLVAAELLADREPGADEGRLTLARARVVSRTSLAAVCRELGLVPHMRRGKTLDPTGGAESDRVACGLFEAVVGAVFRDGGYRAAAAFCRPLLEARLAGGDGSGDLSPKNRLQELAAARGLPLPEYQLVDRVGQDHEPLFEVRARLGNVSCTGVGRTKKEAEQQAAAKVLADAERFPDLLGP